MRRHSFQQRPFQHFCSNAFVAALTQRFERDGATWHIVTGPVGSPADASATAGIAFSLGAAFVVLVPEILRGFGAYHQIIYGMAMIAVFVFWPKGLVGIAELFTRRITAGAKRLAAATSEVPPT